MKKKLTSFVSCPLRPHFGQVLSLVFCFLFLSSATGQGVIQWQNTIGGNGSDNLYSIQQTNDGGYILGGISNSNISGDKLENSNGMDDYWIIRIDSLGNILWQNTIGGSSDDRLHSIQQTSDGGYILGGFSYSNISGDKSENCIGNADIWIVKTDSLGIIQWQNTIGGTGQDELYTIQQTTDRGYILGGTSGSGISGDKTETSNGNLDYWIVKIDSFGNMQWQNTIGGNHDDYLLSIKQTIDGGFILAGNSRSNISGDKSENNLDTNTSSFDYWIVKTDSLGNIQWQNTIGGNDNDAMRVIQQTTEKGYILGGFSYSNISGDKTEDNNGDYYDYWIVKTDSLGSIEWQNTIGGNSTEEFTSIHQTIDGGFILVGNSWSNISGDKTENNLDTTTSTNDCWILKTDASGSIQWQSTIGGKGADIFCSIQQTIDGGYILGGFSYSNISGDKSENSNGIDDYWIVKLTENYNALSGVLFIDGNSNSMHDTGETVVSGKRVSETYGSFAFSEQNGHYSVSVLDTGNYSVSPASLNYYQAVPATHNAHFSGMLITDSLNDFAYQPTGVFNDACVRLTPLGAFRNGFNATYVISYENVGTTTLSGSVVFFPDSTISYVSSSLTPASIFTDSIIWNYSSLAPMQTGSITVLVNVHAGLPLGTLVYPFVRIDPVTGDANPSCNFHSWEVFTTASFDPNDILVDEDTLFSSQFPNPPYLEYIIRFQNTGNDTAFQVKILNPLDTSRLDLSSLEFVASSHPVNMSWLPWERNMEFRFNNILLPDSNTNETLSHSFIRYRIKPKNNLSAGDSIANYAAIYFDFNAPVITNTAQTKILLPTEIPSIPAAEERLIIFPNPATNELILTGYTIQASEKTELHVYNFLGKEVFSTKLSANSYRLNTSSLTPGVYFIRLGNACTNFIKQ